MTVREGALRETGGSEDDDALVECGYVDLCFDFWRILTFLSLFDDLGTNFDHCSTMLSKTSLSVSAGNEGVINMFLVSFELFFHRP